MTYAALPYQPHHAPVMSVNKSESTPTSQPFPFFQVLRYFKAFCYEHSEVNAQHRSLFYYLLEVFDHRGKSYRFQLNREDGMHGAGIGSKNTYLAALKQLHAWGLILYTPGKNGERAAIIEVLPQPSTVPEVGQWKGRWRDSAQDGACDAGETLGGTTKKTLDMMTDNTQERGDELARAQKKIGELEQEITKLKALASAPRTGGGAPAEAVVPALGEGEVIPGGFADPRLSDQDPAKWVARPRDAQMVDEFLATSPNPKLRAAVGKGHLFIDHYAPAGWVFGKFHTPVQNWRHLIQSFQFREPPRPAGGSGNIIQDRLAVIEDAMALNQFDAHGNLLN